MPYSDQFDSNLDNDGGNNVGRYFAQTGDPGSGNPFAKLFGRRRQGSNSPPGSVQSSPLPDLPGQPNTPFSMPQAGQGQPQMPAQPAAQPATSLASAQDIMDKINRMLQGNTSAPMPPSSDDYMPGRAPFSQQSPMPGGMDYLPYSPGGNSPPDRQHSPYSGGARASVAPFNFHNMGAPSAPPRVNMRANAGGGQNAQLQALIAMLQNGGGGSSPFATGGAVPGFMRGGYPQLYDAPVRHTFDSGGESYVGQGEGGGRSDNINARLSPREYVMDAETMALLGDGNPDEGAKKMDELRSNIRKHKGKKLAKGEISPNAKAATSYISGTNAMGSGLNRISVKG